MNIHLASPEPNGRGTAHVESLTSYIRRLARVHRISVSRFLTMLILEPTRRERGQVELALQPTRATESVNGSGAVSALLVSRLATLTERDNLSELTFIQRDRGICMREAFRRRRAWCAHCLVADAAAPYDRLLWALLEYRICLKHLRPLSETCADCRQSQPPLAEWAHPSRCHACGGWLQQAPPTRVGADALMRTGAVAAAFDGILGAVLDGDAVRTEIGECVGRAGSLRRLCRVSGVSVSELSALRAGQVRPHLSAYVSVVTATAVERSPRSRVFPDAQVPWALHEATRRASVPSLRSLAKEMGTTPATLRARWGPLAARVVAAHARQRVSAARLRRAASLRELHEAVGLAAEAGEPGRRQVEMRLKRPGLLRAPWARQALRRARATVK